MSLGDWDNWGKNYTTPKPFLFKAPKKVNFYKNLITILNHK